ncbi:hypothetical protein NMY22_g18469 [Coprinellus aureogranulatus]|nr:hypothetical protein NMY22_g18469 [Coprinellus aureogranulatus]
MHDVDWPHPLQLATSTFRIGEIFECGEEWWNKFKVGDVIVGWGALSICHYVRRNTSEPLRCIFDPWLSIVCAGIVQACGLNPYTACVEHMDQVDERFVCECQFAAALRDRSADHIWTIETYTWRTALTHALVEHKDDPTANTVSFFPVEQLKPGFRVEVDACERSNLNEDPLYVWRCNHCFPNMNHTLSCGLMPFEPMQQHLKNRHRIDQPIVEKDYFLDEAQRLLSRRLYPGPTSRMTYAMLKLNLRSPIITEVRRAVAVTCLVSTANRRAPTPGFPDDSHLVFLLPHPEMYLGQRSHRPTAHFSLPRGTVGAAVTLRWVVPNWLLNAKKVKPLGTPAAMNAAKLKLKVSRLWNVRDSKSFDVLDLAIAVFFAAPGQQELGAWESEDAIVGRNALSSCRFLCHFIPSLSILAGQLVSQCGLDPSTTTAAQMDSHPERFYCSLCALEWGYQEIHLLTWRGALRHACEVHDETGDDGLTFDTLSDYPDATIRRGMKRIVKTEEQERRWKGVWLCSYCYDPTKAECFPVNSEKRKVEGMSWWDISVHLGEKHGVGFPRVPDDYFLIEPLRGKIERPIRIYPHARRALDDLGKTPPHAGGSLTLDGLGSITATLISDTSQ